MSDHHLSPATPWHLWVVGGLLLIFNGFASFDYVATLIRYEPYLSGYSKDVLDYYFNAPIWMYAMWGVSSIGGFLGAAFLLGKRKIAVPITVAALVCSLIAAIYTYMIPPPQGTSVVFLIIILAIAFLVLCYMMRLSRQGVLR